MGSSLIAYWLIVISSMLLITCYRLYLSQNKVKKLESQKPKEISAPQKIEESRPYVKIGKVNASFNKELHECKLPKIGPYGDETKGWDIGTVIACSIPECGQEWVLGYYQETETEKQSRIEMNVKLQKQYLDQMERSGGMTYYSGKGFQYAPGEYLSAIAPSEVKKQEKKWYTMEDYDKDPDRYVYFT